MYNITMSCRNKYIQLERNIFYSSYNYVFNVHNTYDITCWRSIELPFWFKNYFTDKIGSKEVVS